MSNKKTMSNNSAKAITIGTLVLVGAIATGPVFIANYAIWSVVGGFSLVTLFKKDKK